MGAVTVDSHRIRAARTPPRADVMPASWGRLVAPCCSRSEPVRSLIFARTSSSEDARMELLRDRCHIPPGARSAVEGILSQGGFSARWWLSLWRWRQGSQETWMFAPSSSVRSRSGGHRDPRDCSRCCRGAKDGRERGLMDACMPHSRSLAFGIAIAQSAVTGMGKTGRTNKPPYEVVATLKLS